MVLQATQKDPTVNGVDQPAENVVEVMRFLRLGYLLMEDLQEFRSCSPPTCWCLSTSMLSSIMSNLVSMFIVWRHREKLRWLLKNVKNHMSNPI